LFCGLIAGVAILSNGPERSLERRPKVPSAALERRNEFRRDPRMERLVITNFYSHEKYFVYTFLKKIIAGCFKQA
jgi:hypothetical protein